MDPSHAVSCVACHGGDSSSENEEIAHKGLIPDPGDLGSVDKTCGKCHPEESRRVKTSVMALAPRIINHTRFAFGTQDKPLPAYATVDAGSLKQVPHPSFSTNLGDDLLRRSCLRCHLHTRGASRFGEHRGKGCSACHIAYPNSSDGRPRGHVIVRKTGITACLKCHNSNHVGADYVGLFEKDFERGFRSPFMAGRLPPRIYGSEQHRLASDIHFRRGMECMDCHTLDEVHGTGELPGTSASQVTISCEACHVRGDHPAALKEDSGEIILLKGKGRKIPVWNRAIIPHQVEAHIAKLKCSACHATWSFQDYGLHLMLEERADYWKWALTQGQNDPQIQEIPHRYAGTYADVLPPPGGATPDKPVSEWKPPVTKDWLTGEARSGAWFRGYTARRWETLPLGFNSRGKISLMRPMYQYVISHVDSTGTLLVDRVIPRTGSGDPALIFNPYAPHTIGERGRNCHECHGNPSAAGLGEALRGIKTPGITPIWKHEQQIPGHVFRWDAMADMEGKALQKSTHPGAGPLDRDTIGRLMNPSSLHRVLWHKYLTIVPSQP